MPGSALTTTDLSHPGLSTRPKLAKRKVVSITPGSLASSTGLGTMSQISPRPSPQTQSCIVHRPALPWHLLMTRPALGQGEWEAISICSGWGSGPCQTCQRLERKSRSWASSTHPTEIETHLRDKEEMGPGPEGWGGGSLGRTL